jgi:STE24 endopeptidase
MEFNAYAIVILVALLGDHLLGVVADVLNLRAAAETVPEEFSDLYDAVAYGNSQRYLRVRTRFGFVRGGVDLLLLLGFWFLGGFGWAADLTAMVVTGDIPRGLLFIGVLGLARMLLSLPFSWYSVFVLEERFGFNRTTPGTFVRDLLKNLVLSVAIGGPLLAGILWLLGRAGPHAWLWCWLAVALFSLFMQVVYPIWIMPWFNTFEPLAEGDLRTRLLAMAGSVGFPVRRVQVMDGSRRSGHSNAMVTGVGRYKRIALYDTLLADHPGDEIVAITAHEVGHWRRRHIWWLTALHMLHLGVLFFLLSVFLHHTGLFAAFGVEPSSAAGLVFFGLLYTPVELVLAFGLNAFSRRCEFEADQFAAETTGLGDAMIAALKRLSVHNLSNLTPHPLTVALEYSHPPVLARIEALRSTAHPSEETAP